MSEKVITSMHIEKLGHDIGEIRERALFNILSKLEHGFTFDNDLPRSKEILMKLFDWFVFEPCNNEAIVLKLIKRILESESGRILINHLGVETFKKEIKQISKVVKPKFLDQLRDIEDLLDAYTTPIVPPLETDLPLSYRSIDTDPRNIESTMRSYNNYFYNTASTQPQNDGYNSESTSSTKTHITNKTNYLIRTLKWQSLIEPDRHVLVAIENSLTRPPEPSALLHSTEFFMNVLLSDFPAEVFLQRPNTVNAFHELLLNCKSTRITNSILSSLYHLTKALQIRVNHYNDPSMYNSKEVIISQSSSQCSSPDSASRKAASGQSFDEFDKSENIILLKKQQISLPTYCFNTLNCVLKFLLSSKSDSARQYKIIINLNNINIALNLLEELTKLTSLVIGKEIWDDESEIKDLSDGLKVVLKSYSELLNHLRLEADSNDANLEIRVYYLCVLHSCINFITKLIPKSQSEILLPHDLKQTLSQCLVDVILAQLYPEAHRILLEYVESFSASNDFSSALKKYRETEKVCGSISAAISFLKKINTISASGGVDLIKKALISLEFHKDKYFVRHVIEFCINKAQLHPYNTDLLRDFEYVILKLLSHFCDDIKEEAYKLCQKQVVSSVGPKLISAGTPGSQILFLITPKILLELSCHGLINEKLQIRNFAEDILIHVIKCKILVPEDIWNKIVEALIPALPILLCHTNKSSSLGRLLFNILDPETADSMLIPQIQVIRGNINLLFNSEDSVREEGFARLSWLLAYQDKSREMIPRINNLSDKALPHVCQTRRRFDINRSKTTHHFYQPSSLQQVLDLLKSSNVEPVIRRSALTQISVMMEDPLLHKIFIENEGIEIILSVMKSALTEKNFTDYPDSVVPIISVLKNIALYNSTVRRNLSEEREVYFNILRGLFMFFTDEILKQDSICLLFVLIFNDFIYGSPAKGDFSIPFILSQKLLLPFSCSTYGRFSEFTEENRLALLSSDKWCLSSIQIHWNLENFGGIENLLSWKQIDYNKDKLETPELLKMNPYNLQCLKYSSMQYCIKKYLCDIQNATTHDSVMSSIQKLTTYLLLYGISKSCDDIFNEYPWENTFVRFFKSLPSSKDDIELLNSVLKLMKILTSLQKYSDSGNEFWIAKMLKNSCNCILDLTTLDPSSKQEFKELNQNLLSLISSCATKEQHFLDFQDYKVINKTHASSWNNIVQLIANNLKFNETTHFYNLSYLDSLLSCLAHITASLGWSKSANIPKKLFTQMIIALCELIVVFHTGKGPTATVSVMGLSITRHVVLILNHVLAEMQFIKMKHWDSCFLEVEEDEWLKSFLVLWFSRDVVLRAAAIQFFAGLAVSSRLVNHMIANELKYERKDVWNLAFSLLFDEEEASIVKEQCGLFLTNLIKHRELRNANNKSEKNDLTYLLKLLEDHQFYNSLVPILNSLYTNQINQIEHNDDLNKFQIRDYFIETPTESTNSKDDSFIVTPAFVKALVLLLYNLSDVCSKEVAENLHENGLIKLLFRCICNPLMSLSDTKKMSLYCEIIEMNTSICILCGVLAKTSQICRGTIIHTKDCLNMLVSLLNPKIYDTHFPQLLYLRNQLWTSIFRLLTVLIGFGDALRTNKHSQDALNVITETIYDVGKISFLETLHESISSQTFIDLQHHALILLSVLATTESLKKCQGEFSVRNLLDTCRIIDCDVEDRSNNYKIGAEITKTLIDLYTLRTLETPRQEDERHLLSSALAAILSLSQEAKNCAYRNGFLKIIIKQLSDFQLKLSLESIECLKKITDKKRICPLLNDLNDLIGLISNFMINDQMIKVCFAESGLSDLIHKVWMWITAQKVYMINTLKMLVNFTTNCEIACQSLPLTSAIAGTGPRKNPTKYSLLHAVIDVIEKEMDQISKTHNLLILELCFKILNNCCNVLECRILLSKSNLLNNIYRLHPAVTKRQKPWDKVELIWLSFFENFSLYPEGQSQLAKINDIFDLVITLINIKSSSSTIALSVLRNIAFYQPNRARLLSSDDFLNVLHKKLQNGTPEEKDIIVLIIWTLAANNQKAKIVFKSAQLDLLLEQSLKHYELSSETISESIKRMNYVYNMITETT